MLSLYTLKQLLNPEKESEPSDDFRIIRSWAEYDKDSTLPPDVRNLEYLCYELETMNPETGERIHYYKAVKFARVIRLPADAKQSTAFMDMQEQILTGVHEQGYNFITIIANIIKPVAIGLLFLYGVQGISENLEDAKRRAHYDFKGFIGMMQGTFRVLELSACKEQESEWLREKMYNMDYLTVVRGIPKANKAGENAGNKGIGGSNLNPDSQGTLEELITGMADYEYVVEVLSAPVSIDTLTGWQRRSQMQMTEWNSQLQGQKSLSMNLSIPMMYMANASQSQGWSKGYTDANSVSYARGESFTMTQGQSVGQSLSQSFGRSFGQTAGQSFTNSFSQGVTHSKGVNFGESFGENRGWNQSISESVSHSINQGQSIGTSHGFSRGQSLGMSQGQNIGQNIGSSQGMSVNRGLSQGLSQNSSQSLSEGTNTSQGLSRNQGTSYNVGQGMNTSQSHNVGQGQNIGFNQSESASISNGATYGRTQSESISRGLSENFGTGTNTSYNIGHSHSDSGSRSASASAGYNFNDGWNTSKSQNSSFNFGGNVSGKTPFLSGIGIGGHAGGVIGSGVTNGKSHGEGANQGYSFTENMGYNNGYSLSSSDGVSYNHSLGSSVSNSASVGTSASQSASMSQSQSAGISQGFSSNESFGTSVGNSLSQGWGSSSSLGESYSMGNSVSKGLSVGQGQSESISNGMGANVGSSAGQSWGSNTGISQSANVGENWGVTQSVTQGESWGTSQGISQGESYGISHSTNVGQSESVANSQTLGQSLGQSVSESVTENSSTGYGQNVGQSESISNGNSYTTSNGISRGISNAMTGASTLGTSSSMGLGPSIGYSKSYAWKDQGVQDLLELLEYQNERIKKALRGQGAFYTYLYIACPSLDALSTAQAIAKATWQNEFAMTQPLQVLDLTETEQKHLLYHFNAFSSDVTKEDVYNVRQYKYCTVLLPEEYVAYTHLPRISEGGIFAYVQDIPKFSVPSMMKGEIYMGTILNSERYTFNNGYRTQFDYRIDEDSLMHGFFTGASRSGKTVAAMRFVAELSQIRRKKTGKRLRIVVMDPKQDWRTLARYVEPERFNFHSLGNLNFRPVKINPWKIPLGVWPQVWIDGIIDIYCRAYGLLERGKQMIGSVVYALYQEAGVFDECDKGTWNLELSKVCSELSAKVSFKKIYDRMYAEKANLEDPNNKGGKAGNDTRDAYARLLDRLSCFDRAYSIENQLYGTTEGCGIDELIGDDDVTVLESKGLENTFKNFIFGAITSGFYKFALAHEGGFLADDQYETVLVIEEANEILTGNDAAGSGGSSEFQLAGQSEFEQILDQSAGYGLFVFAITQKIGDMPSSIIANCGLVFAGRLKRPSDIEVVVRSVGREERIDDRDLVKWFPRSPTGWFVCQTSRTFDFKDAEPILVQIARLNIQPPKNYELEEILLKRDAMKLLKGTVTV